MKKLLSFLFIFTLSFSLLSQEVISSNGESYSNANGSISYTIGELVINTLSSAGNDLTQGFQQSGLGVLAIDDFDIDYLAKAYPNPTADVLQLEIENFQGLNYEIFDLQGRKLGNAIIVNRVTEVTFNQFAVGMYLLVILNENNQKLKTYRIIKN